MREAQYLTMGVAVLSHYTNVDVKSLGAQINGYEFVSISFPARSPRLNPSQSITLFEYQTPLSVRSTIVASKDAPSLPNPPGIFDSIYDKNDDRIGNTVHFYAQHYKQFAQSRTVFEECEYKADIGPGKYTVLTGYDGAWAGILLTISSNVVSVICRNNDSYYYTDVQYAAYSFIVKIEYAV